MSRGFVKEDDQEDVPMVPPRALTNKKVGDRVVLKRPKGDQVLIVMNISWKIRPF
jgi:hypothetical protein